MKLTIITGPQGTGKTKQLEAMLKNYDVAMFIPERLHFYPVYLPGMRADIKKIVFDNMYNLSDFYRLAAIIFEQHLKFKRHLPGFAESRSDIDIIIATQMPKKNISFIFRGLNNVKFIELKHEISK